MRVFLHSGGPLGPVGRAALPEFLGPITRVAFVTAASLHDEETYFERIRAALAPAPPDGAGLDVLHLKWDDRPLETLARADAVFMGGGNTYALLKRLVASGLLPAIRARVEGGMPYIGRERRIERRRPDHPHDERLERRRPRSLRRARARGVQHQPALQGSRSADGRRSARRATTGSASTTS